MRILVTGSAGFIGGYLVRELLDRDCEVVGLDNFSKYGPIARAFDTDPRFRQVDGDAKDAALVTRLLADCDYLVAGAAKIGGISYFHRYAYDLIAENERITAATFDAALECFRLGTLQRIVVVSSSMVYENATEFPTPEGHERRCPPPESTYGFQKLACEYFARGAAQQYGLPCTIVRPFNCVGIGERRALSSDIASSGNIKLALSHVVPDLVQKVLRGQNPLHLLGDGSQVRCYTYGGDLAKGIATAMFHPAAVGEAFNLSTAASTTVLELAELIWKKVHGTGPGAPPFAWVSDPPFEFDVPYRVPDVSKARRVLGFEAATTLEQVLDEVIDWVREEIAADRI